MGEATRPWWRSAVIYQIYVRSFADASGDGIGDLAGARAHLGYLHALGVDAVWFNPWYASPFADGGYDVADYRAIEPSLGTLADAEAFIAEASTVGIRTIVDIVPNHVSAHHAWFVAALESEPGSPERERFWFRPGRGASGELPPNDWRSEFGDIAWTRLKDADGRGGEWYLHLFSPSQPDLNWTHPDVRAEHESVLRFWFDRGAAGVRIDSAALAAKDPDLPDLEPSDDPRSDRRHPYVDRDELHDLYRSWRSIADSYDPPRILIGEVWLPDRKRFAAYLRPDELHAAFNFEFLRAPWDPTALRRTIVDTLDDHRGVGAPPTWVLANHDVTRTTTRYGRADTSFAFAGKRIGIPTDVALGSRRARAAALLALALPGCFYVYQGEELGLPEVEDLPVDSIQDPMHFQSGGVDPGRDGCRVPLPWVGDAPPYGFSPDGARATPWLPQPNDWADVTVDAQLDRPGSTLDLYRRAIRLRADRFASADAELTWLDTEAFEPGAGDRVLAFARGDMVCVTNFSDHDIALPHGRVVLSSDERHDGRLDADATAWVEPISTSATPATSTPATNPNTTTEEQRG